MSEERRKGGAEANGCGGVAYRQRRWQMSNRLDFQSTIKKKNLKKSKKKKMKKRILGREMGRARRAGLSSSPSTHKEGGSLSFRSENLPRRGRGRRDFLFNS